MASDRGGTLVGHRANMCNCYTHFVTFCPDDIAFPSQIIAISLRPWVKISLQSKAILHILIDAPSAASRGGEGGGTNSIHNDTSSSSFFSIDSTYIELASSYGRPLEASNVSLSCRQISCGDVQQKILQEASF